MERVAVDRDVSSVWETTDKDIIYRALLQHEDQQLRCVVGSDDLCRWRDRLVRELGRPDSAYARAMTSPSSMTAQAQDAMQYAVFLERWKTIITDTIRRLQRQQSVIDDHTPEELATAILAAVHGGVLLTRVTKNADTLRNALNLPFDHLCPAPLRGGPS
jgi:hypothetical protein